MHRIPLPLPNDGLRAVNVYVLESADGLVLIDGGWALPEARDALAAGLSAIGAGLGDVKRFLVTHLHRDHYTMAVLLRRETGASVALGAGEHPSLTAAQNPRLDHIRRDATRLRALGAGQLAELLEAVDPAATRQDDLWEPPDEWLHEGPLALPGGRELDAVSTPGTRRATWCSTT